MKQVFIDLIGIAGAACVVAGVYLIGGLPSALIFGGAFAIVAAALMSR